MNLLIMLAVALVVLWIDYEVQRAPLLNDIDPYPARPESSDGAPVDVAAPPTPDP